MSGLLAVDRLPYRVLAGWVALVRAGVVWLLLCLPVVTAPAATVVLVRTVATLADGRTPPTIAGSWLQVRACCTSALRLAAVTVAGWGIAGSALLGPSPGGVWDSVLPMVAVPVAVTWALAVQWSFPLLAERGEGARDALRCSYLRAIRRPDLAALCAVGTAALVVVGVLLPATVWLPYWLSVPALWAWLASTTSRRAAPQVSPLHRSQLSMSFPNGGRHHEVS
jgi:uncharacterized membrane protein YesL